MEFSIWDLDNCVSDDEWRIKFVDWTKTNGDERYAEYHRRCFADRPGNVAVFKAIAARTVPLFFTARPENVRKSTVAWLREQLGVRDPIVKMRPMGDGRSSPVLKLEMLDEMFLQRAEIFCAFDDRMDVVAAYRARGIPATLLAIHATCAMTPPNS